MNETSKRSIERKLTTIMSADMAGYSNLMERDEPGTLERLRDARSTMKALIERHRGRIANTAGDSILAEFPSTVEAVGCAVEIQNELAAKASTNPEIDPLLFRIGINLGDVMIEADGDLFGDGVNVAARLQALAKPGRIMVSRAVKEMVQGKLDVRFSSKGEQQLHNIAQPVETFVLKTGKTDFVGKVISGEVGVTSKIDDKSNNLLLGFSAVLILFGFLFGHWLVWPGIVIGWISAGPFIKQHTKDPERREALNIGTSILALALINLAGSTSDPWFIYPSIVLILVFLLRRRKKVRA
ncbi:MAG: adenylate/guanylate cyclase domain-containing protein [Pseudomonadota bacterium]